MAFFSVSTYWYVDVGCREDFRGGEKGEIAMNDYG